MEVLIIALISWIALYFISNAAGDAGLVRLVRGDRDE